MIDLTDTFLADELKMTALKTPHRRELYFWDLAF